MYEILGLFKIGIVHVYFFSLLSMIPMLFILYIVARLDFIGFDAKMLWHIGSVIPLSLAL
jgi:hypothetical protein